MASKKSTKVMQALNTDGNARAEAFALEKSRQLGAHGQLKSASAYELPFLHKRLPTGIMSLDLALKGGFPAGGISMITGTYSSFKSGLYWMCIAQLQKILGNNARILLAMTELRADRSQGRMLGAGVAMSDDEIAYEQRYREFLRSNAPPDLPPETFAPLSEQDIALLKSQVGLIHELHAESAEFMFDTILDAVARRIYHLIVIDSFGSIIAAAEAESESVSQKHYGGSAGVNTQFLRKLCPLMNMDDDDGHTRDMFILGVNQVRDAIGDPHKEFRSPGGRMLGHTKLVDLVTFAGALNKEAADVMTIDGNKKMFVAESKNIYWKVEKGKAGMHEGAQGSFRFVYGKGVDVFADAWAVGVNVGVVEVAGSFYSIRDPNNPDNVLIRTQGKDAFINALQEDALAKAKEGNPNSLFGLIREAAYTKYQVTPKYDWRD